MSTGYVLDAVAYMSAIERDEGLVIDDTVGSVRVRSGNVVLRVLLLLLLMLVLAHGEPETVKVVDDSLVRPGVSCSHRPRGCSRC